MGVQALLGRETQLAPPPTLEPPMVSHTDRRSQVYRQISRWYHSGGLLGNIARAVVISRMSFLTPRNYRRQNTEGSVIFVNENENENGEKRENNDFVNEN